jgi:hypothetical protein
VDTVTKGIAARINGCIGNCPVYLFVFLHLLVLIASSAMALSPRDAIHLDDIDRYDSFMKELDSATDHFLDMYMKNSMITVDVLYYPTNVIARSEQFTPSSVAQEYFDQERGWPKKFLEQTRKTMETRLKADSVALARARTLGRGPMIFIMSKGAQTAFNSVARLQIAGGTMAVHTATPCDRAAFGRSGAAEANTEAPWTILYVCPGVKAA